MHAWVGTHMSSELAAHVRVRWSTLLARLGILPKLESIDDLFDPIARTLAKDQKIGVRHLPDLYMRARRASLDQQSVLDRKYTEDELRALCMPPSEVRILYGNAVINYELSSRGSFVVPMFTEYVVVPMTLESYGIQGRFHAEKRRTFIFSRFHSRRLHEQAAHQCHQRADEILQQFEKCHASTHYAG